MSDRMTVSWKGDEYEVVRKTTRKQAPHGPVWRVRRNGALITSFPANPADTPAEVKEKVVGWLRGYQARPVHDVDRQ